MQTRDVKYFDWSKATGKSNKNTSLTKHLHALKLVLCKDLLFFADEGNEGNNTDHTTGLLLLFCSRAALNEAAREPGLWKYALHTQLFHLRNALE